MSAASDILDETSGQPLHIDRAAKTATTKINKNTSDVNNSAMNSQRHIHLDGLRGFAVMGILTINIGAFALPQNAYFAPLDYGGSSLTNAIAYLVNFILFDGKMRGLFSLLFGASMMLIIMRAEANGLSSAKIHYNRMFWLIIFGLLHFIFIWFGDILFLYGVMGCIAYLMHHMDARQLLKWGIGLYAAMTLLLSLMLGGLLVQKYQAVQPDASEESIMQYEDFTYQFYADSALSHMETMAYKGSYSDAVNHRITEEWSTPLWSILIGFSETLPLMMIGMALLKNGFLLGGAPPRHYNAIILYGLGGALIISAILAAIIWQSDFDIAVLFNVQQAWGAIPRFMMTIGYAALFIMIMQRFSQSALIIRVAAAGRMAFTNYIGTSIIMTFIFYGYGLDYFGEIGRLEQIYMVIAMWVLMMIWSKPWLMHYHYGPLEWLWRSLARRKWQAFKRL